MLVNWTVTNEDATNTVISSWQDNVYAESTQGSQSVSFLGSFTHYGSLAPNASYTQTQLVTLPISLSTGAYNLFVVTNEYPPVPPGLPPLPHPASTSNLGSDTSAAIPIAITQELPGPGGYLGYSTN